MSADLHFSVLFWGLFLCSAVCNLYIMSIYHFKFKQSEAYFREKALPKHNLHWRHSWRFGGANPHLMNMVPWNWNVYWWVQVPQIGASQQLGKYHIFKLFQQAFPEYYASCLLEHPSVFCLVDKQKSKFHIQHHFINFQSRVKEYWEV